MILFSLLTLTFLLRNVKLSSSLSLTTTYNSSTGQNGNMFDIQILQNNGVTIQSFDLHIKSLKYTVESYEIYKKKNGYTSNQGWEKIACAEVVSNGPLVPSPLPIGGMRKFYESTGKKVGLYITLTTGVSNYLNYSYGGIVGDVFVSNANLRIMQGVGVIYPFSPIQTSSARVWNGSIYYVTGNTTGNSSASISVSGDCMPSARPSTAPTRKPTRKPTKSPTKKPSAKPSHRPTRRPTKRPTRKPTRAPTRKPTKSPTKRPSSKPSSKPSPKPSRMPSRSPTSLPSRQPSRRPTRKPSSRPTSFPTPKDYTPKPTPKQSNVPTNDPSKIITRTPTRMRTLIPMFPTTIPSDSPSLPSLVTRAPVRYTQNPSLLPSIEPTYFPTHVFSTSPTALASSPPSQYPTAEIIPSYRPTYSSMSPTISNKPSVTASSVPLLKPSTSSNASSFPTVEEPMATPVLIACVASSAAVASAVSSLAASGGLHLLDHRETFVEITQKPAYRVRWKTDEELTEVRYYHKSSFQIYDEVSFKEFKRSRRREKKTRKQELVDLKERIKRLAADERMNAKKYTNDQAYSLVM